MTELTEKQILVAGIGNAWLQDDGFGGEVVRRLRRRQMPDGVTLGDFGTGGLDLAYEVMRGYDALVLVDVSRQGGEPGTLYVMEPRGGRSPPGSRTAQVVDPHGMDPETVLRFVQDGRRLARQGDGGRLRAGGRRGVGIGPHARGRRGRRPGRRPGGRDVGELQSDAAYAS